MQQSLGRGLKRGSHEAQASRNVGVSQSALPSDRDARAEPLPPDASSNEPADPGIEEEGGRGFSHTQGGEVTRYKGVQRIHRAILPTFQAMITTAGKQLYLGSFRTPEAAARAYDAAADVLRGPDAKANFPNEATDLSLLPPKALDHLRRVVGSGDGVVGDGVPEVAGQTPKLTSSGSRWAHYPTTEFQQQQQQQQQQQRKRKKAKRFNRPQYKGVWQRKDGTLRAGVYLPGSVRVELGCFKTAEEAARAFDAASLFAFGDAAQLNFPDEKHKLPQVPHQLQQRMRSLLRTIGTPCEPCVGSGLDIMDTCDDDEECIGQAGEATDACDRVMTSLCGNQGTVVQLEATPAVELEAKPAAELEAQPAVELEAKPAVEQEAKPAVEQEAKPAVELEAKPAVAPEVKPAVEAVPPQLHLVQRDCMEGKPPAQTGPSRPMLGSRKTAGGSEQEHHSRHVSERPPPRLASSSNPPNDRFNAAEADPKMAETRSSVERQRPTVKAAYKEVAEIVVLDDSDDEEDGQQRHAGVCLGPHSHSGGEGSSQGMVQFVKEVDPAATVWAYRGEDGKVHGPWSLQTLKQWMQTSDFFRDVKIWFAAAAQSSSVLGEDNAIQVADALAHMSGKA